MPSSPTSLGPYRIERELGRGGMGIVYLAHDTRLNRRVAIKALPDAVAADPDRMARFEREARVLASLNHPNLAAVYDVLEVDGRRYLAMEYIEGEPLADRLRRDGALSIAETVEICHQIAAGMEAAHEGGVVHRDLKPENVMITSGERVKVVDFGLAKGRVSGEEPPRGHAVSPVLSSSPTLEAPGTMPGVILGTAPYLSPEQARGKVVDRRTDIWSFGCIVYECLTGRKLFLGETVSDTIAAILERPLDWSGLPKETPPRIRELLERCLERDPRKRLRDIGEAGLMLEGARPAAAPAAAPPKAEPLWRRIVPIVGLLGAVILGWHLFGASILSMLRGPSEPVRRVSIEIPRDLKVTFWDFTPDGTALLVVGRPKRPGEPTAETHIYRRRLDGSEFHPIAGTERVGGFGLSPDGTVIYFLASSAQGPDITLKRVPADGSSPAITVAPWQRTWIPGVALSSGKLLLTVTSDQWASLAEDGTISKATSFDIPGYKGDILLDDVLPHGRGVLLRLLSSSASASQAALGVLDLRTKKSKMLLANVGDAAYDPAGRLLFTRQGTLLAVPFDLGRLEVRGEPVAVADDIYALPATITIAYAHDGTLAYRPGGAGDQLRRLVSVNRNGSVTSWSPAQKPFETMPSLSPDGTKIGCSVTGEQGNSELWVLDRGQRSGDLLEEDAGATAFGPAWSPDGDRIAFGLFGGKQDGVYIKDLRHGTPASFLGDYPGKSWRTVPTAWSSDGSTILIVMGNLTVMDVGTIPAGGQVTPLKIQPLLSDPWEESMPTLSPDGTWMAYQTTQTGRWEAYLRPFLPGPAVGRPIQVSTDGGSRPAWGRGGEALYYESPDGHVMSVAFRGHPTVNLSPPSPVWDLNALRIVSYGWDIAPDGTLVGIQKAEDEDELRRIDLVLHCDKELDSKMKLSRK